MSLLNNIIPEKCGEACGYAAAIVAAVCFGSFGVPVKSDVVSRLDVDPLVMQSYKSAMGFLTCWLIIPIGGGHYPPRFTTYGILSGLFWVPGGVAGIYGIRHAGLAVAVGTWSSLIVLTSFAWGVFVFEEHVKSIHGACCACGTLMAGLIGMSIYSRPQQQQQQQTTTTCDDDDDDDDDEREGYGGGGWWRGGVVSARGGGGERNRAKHATTTTESMVAVDEEGVRKRMIHHTSKDSKEEPSSSTAESKLGGTTSSKRAIIAPPNGKKAPPPPTKSKMEEVKANSEKISSQSSLLPSQLPLEMEYLLDHGQQGGGGGSSSPHHDGNKIWTMTLFERQVTLTKRQVGLLACMFNGLWGGTAMIPLHFAAHTGYGGPSYVISFCCGSMLVTIALWMIRFLFELYRLDGAVGKAYRALPSFHVRQMWLQGGLSGALWSAGNFFAIVSVTQLGQGVGYSSTQASMLVSGLWGIFRFKEIEGRERILKWLSSACVALTGIMWLSYEHAS